jgi:phospholipid/cholesterol/gamma-HCH transport system ATP-binding protein
MLEVSNIRRSFGDREVLSGVSLKLDAGTIAGLIGPSGGGKSVLLKIIGRILKPHSGTVSMSDCAPTDVSLMFQEGALFDSLNVFDNVAFPLVNGKVPTFLLSRRNQEEVHRQVEEILGRVGLSQALYKMPAQLSGGMRRRVSLARALVTRPKLVLLDDPTCGLDPVASSVIMDLITELHRDYRPTMLIVSQDLRRLLPVVEKVFALFDGKISFSGTVNELSRRPCEIINRFVTCRYEFPRTHPRAQNIPSPEPQG